MPRILLLLAIVFILWYLWQQIKNLQKKAPQERKSAHWKIIFVALFVLTLGLVITGRAHWLTAAAAGLLLLAKNFLTIAIRTLPLLKFWPRSGNTPFGPRIKTAYLEIKVDLRNGNLDGKILQGEFEGQMLSALDRPQLDKLAADLAQQHRESALMLNAYLARRFGGQGQQYSQQGQQSAPGQTNSGLTRQEALDILGLQTEANKEDIIKAHKRLIQKLHPDRGGNDYLAAKVNAAKDLLLGHN